MKLEKVKSFILNKMETELPYHFYYHSVEHTLDVLNSAISICESEKINDDEKKLVSTAALFHDSGFIYQVKDHEERSCEMAHEILINYDYSVNEIAQICGMIMATKLPQNPKNHLEEIMCDADLDYLGRADFFETGNKLFEEFSYLGVVKNERAWNELQFTFFESHKFFTKTSVRLRQKQKEIHLNLIKEKLTN